MSEIGVVLVHQMLKIGKMSWQCSIIDSNILFAFMTSWSGEIQLLLARFSNPRMHFTPEHLSLNGSFAFRSAGRDAKRIERASYKCLPVSGTLQ